MPNATLIASGSPWMTGDPSQDGPALEDLVPSGQTATQFAKSDSNEPWLNSLIDRANSGDTSAYEKLIDYYMTKDSERTAREWTATREDNQYQRLVEDLKKAGISPYVLSGATAGVSSSSGKTYSGSQMTSSANNQRNQKENTLKSILQLLGVIIGASIYALI